MSDYRCHRCGKDIVLTVAGEWIHTRVYEYITCGHPALPPNNYFDKWLAELDEIDRILQ